MTLVREALICVLLVTGALLSLIGAVGLARLPDFMMRLQAPTKAATLGTGALLVASIVQSGAREGSGVREILITVFLLLTAPVAANLLGQAAIRLRVKLRVQPPEEAGVARDRAPPADSVESR